MSKRLHFETSSRGVFACILMPMALLLSCDDDDSNDNNYGTGGGAGTSGGNIEVGGKSSGGSGTTGTGANSSAGSLALGGNSNGTIGGGPGNGGSSANSGTTVAGAGTEMHGTAGAAGSAATSFTSLYDSVISARCLPCHSSGPGVSVGMLDMSTRALAFTSLVGSHTSGVPAMGMSPGTAQTTCASLTNSVRVHPGNATTSLLWQKVNSKLAGTNAPCGNPMPPSTGASLTQTQVDEIAAWINRGAPND